MKYLFLFLVNLIIVTIAVSQSSMDTLLMRLADNKLDKKENLQLLSDFAELRYLDIFPDTAIMIAEHMLSYKDSSDYVKIEAEAHSLLGRAYDIKSEFRKALDHLHKADSLFDSLSDIEGLSDISYPLINCYRKLGDYERAFEYAEKSLIRHESLGDTSGIAWDYYAIGSFSKGKRKSLHYFNLSLQNFLAVGDKKGIARAYNGIGYVLVSNESQDNYEYAIECLNNSIRLHREIGNLQFQAYGYNNLGIAFMRRKEYDKAIDFFKKSYDLKIQLEDRWAEIETLLRIGETYKLKGDNEKAFQWCKQSLDVSSDIEGNHWLQEIYKCLYESAKALNRLEDAIYFNDLYLVLSDSLQNLNLDQKIGEMEFEKQILTDSLAQEAEKLRLKMEHERILSEKNATRNYLVASALLILIIAAGLWSRLNFMRKAKKEIEKQKERSDELLLNILPAEVAEELKIKGKAEAREFDEITILFTDFKEFTKLADKMNAHELVSEIDICFQAFDNICSKYKIEKIKTIGDSYMAAGGLPVPFSGSVKNTVLAAFEMSEFITSRKRSKKDLKDLAFEMRIGINTGPAVAGVVGVKKFQYDIWGDTVNTASRMETNGDVGKINISESTYAYIKDEPEFSFVERGELEVKGKGKVRMYFVQRV